MYLLAIVESPLWSDVDSPAWLQGTLYLSHLLLVAGCQADVAVVVATATAASTHNTGHRGGAVAGHTPTPSVVMARGW